MEPRTLHRRLAATLAGIGIAALAAVGFAAALPAQSAVDGARDYGYVYSGTKSSSADFVRAAMDEDTLLVLGSSEFSTPASLVPQVPSELFGRGNSDVRLMLVGEAFDQSIWHAIALGALADGGLPKQKVALIVAPGWFVDGGQDAETFGTRFSYTLYRGFCENDAIDAETRAYVRERLAQLGIDETRLLAAEGSGIDGAINGVAFELLDDIKLRRGLAEVRGGGIVRAEAAGSQDGSQDTASGRPDFESLRDEAAVYGAEHSTTNDWGVEDGFWNNQLAPALDSVEGYRAGETYSDTPEYDDLACFLAVARDCGVEPLVVICPVMGPYYDHIGIDAQTRKACYDRIRAVCDEAGVVVADYSDREYEKYFLYDIVHFGWTGWVDVGRDLYDFAVGAQQDGRNGDAG